MLLVGLQPVFLPNIACPRDGASGLPVLKILSKQPWPSQRGEWRKIILIQRSEIKQFMRRNSIIVEIAS